jgi:hypothetical protein
MKRILCVLLLPTMTLIGFSKDALCQSKDKCHKDVNEFTMKSMAVIELAKGSNRGKRLADLRTKYATKLDPAAFRAAKEAVENWRIWIDTGDAEYIHQTVSAQEAALEVCNRLAR